MSIDKEQLKREYEAKNGITSANSGGEIYRANADGGATDQSHDFTIREAGTIQQATRRSRSQVQRGERSASELDRSQREYGGTSQSGNGSAYQNSQSGSADLGFGTGEQVELPTDRIINVATTKPRRGRTPKATPEKQVQQPVRAVVVDVLKGAEVESTRERLRVAFIGIFKAFDDFINISVKEKPPQRIQIWTLISDHEINTLVNARIERATKSVIEARIVKGIITLYEQFATGMITFPRMWQTMVTYDLYGFEMPGANLFNREKRKRRNLRVVDATAQQQ